MLKFSDVEQAAYDIIFRKAQVTVSLLLDEYNRNRLRRNRGLPTQQEVRN